MTLTAVGTGQRLLCWSGVIRTDSSAFPICLGDRVDRAGKVDQGEKAVVKVRQARGIGSAARGLSNHQATLERLDVIGELFAAREGVFGREDEEGLPSSVGCAAQISGPELFDATTFAMVKGIHEIRLA